MKVTSIELRSQGQLYAELSLFDPMGIKPFLIRDHIGLGADEVLSRFSGFDKGDGGKQHNLSLPNKEINFVISLNPDYSIGQDFSTLRDDLYRMIYSSRKANLDLIFMNGVQPVGYISGFINKLQPVMHTKTPEVNLSVRCTSPFIKLTSEIEVDVSLLNRSFTIVDSISTAPHGFRFAIHFDVFCSTFALTDSLSDPTWEFRITPGVINGFSGFGNDDILYVSSEDDNKSIYIDRYSSGNIYHLADAITGDSVWPLIFPSPAQNLFQVDANLNVTFDWLYIKHTPTFWGI